MNRVEFVGAMGAGKSSIFETLFKMVRGDSGIFEARHLKKEIFLKEARRTSSVHHSLLKILCLSKRLEANLINDKVTASAWKAVAQQAANWKPLIDDALSQDHGSVVGCADQLIRTSWFIRDLTDVALLLESNYSDITAVHDESLLQRGVGFGLGETDADDFAERYFRNVPVPDLVVHVDVPDPDLLMHRVRARPRNESRIIDHLPKAIELSKTGARIMRDRGVPVSYCDGRDDVKANAMRVLRAVEGRFVVTTQN